MNTHAARSSPACCKARQSVDNCPYPDDSSEVSHTAHFTASINTFCLADIQTASTPAPPVCVARSVDTPAAVPASSTAASSSPAAYFLKLRLVGKETKRGLPLLSVLLLELLPLLLELTRPVPDLTGCVPRLVVVPVPAFCADTF
jgi:hypothetical protein